MPAAGQKRAKTSERTEIIQAVKNPINFFVLVLLLLVEVGLGSLAVRAKGENQLIVSYGILVIIMALIVVVSLLAWKRPSALLGEGAEITTDLSKLRDFCKGISGEWWERIRPDTPSALSWVEITPHLGKTTVRLTGQSYGLDGSLAATWESVASCVNPDERKVFYQWRGLHPLRPQEPYEGFGEIDFAESLDRGSGAFLDTNLVNLASTTRKSVVFVRSAKAETEIVNKGDTGAIADLVRKKLTQVG